MPTERYKQHWMAENGDIPEGRGLYVPCAFLNCANEIGLSVFDTLIVLQLTNYRWHKKARIFPSQKLIAKRTGISLPTIKRSLKKLSDIGLINIIYNGRKCEYDITPIINLVIEHSKAE